MTDAWPTWDWTEHTRCSFCGDKTNGQSWGRSATYLCRGCYDEWHDRFPEIDPADLKRVTCGRCDGRGEHVVSIDLTDTGWSRRTSGCHQCAGYGWRFALKSPLEQLAEVGMKRQR